MLVEASTLTAMVIVAVVGAFAGVVAGFIAGADSLGGTALMGAIGGVALSAVLLAFGAPSIYGVGAEDFSLVWSLVGGLVLGYAVGRSN